MVDIPTTKRIMILYKRTVLMQNADGRMRKVRIERFYFDEVKEIWEQTEKEIANESAALSPLEKQKQNEKMDRDAMEIIRRAEKSKKQYYTVINKDKMEEFLAFGAKAELLAKEIAANVLVEILSDMRGEIKIASECFWFMNQEGGMEQKNLLIELMTKAETVCICEIEHKGRGLTEITFIFDLFEKVKKK